jgi:hypothetical protein
MDECKPLPAAAVESAAPRPTHPSRSHPDTNTGRCTYLTLPAIAAALVKRRKSNSKAKFESSLS